MTKRFDVGNLKIQDNAPKGRVYLLYRQGGVNALCSLINGLNDKSKRLEKENEQLKQHIKRVFQEEYNKCDIPVWRSQYVKSLAEKLGVDLNE